MEEQVIKPKFEVIGQDEQGREIRLYADGSKRNWRGQLIEKPPYAVEITPETNAYYQKRRKQKILEAIEKRITDVTKMNHPADAIAFIVGKRAEIAMNDDGKVGNDAARIVLSAVDAFQDKQEDRTSVLRHEYSIDDDTRALLDAMIQDRRNTHTDVDNSAIDGDVKENNIE